MISKLGRPEKLIFAALFLALLTHFVSTLRQTYVEPLVARKVEDSAAAPIPQRNVSDLQASSEAFSMLFGVTPQTVQQQTEQSSAPDTLVDMQPKLLAIDEINNKLTARLWLNNIQGSRLISAAVGDVIHGYTLTQLTSTVALFSHNAQPEEQPLPVLSLQLFKTQAE